jgi:hypothetical protein
MDNPENPRDQEAIKGVKRDIAELRKSTEKDLLEIVLYEAIDPNNPDPLVRLVHTVKWLAAQQIILNEKLRTLTIAAWVFGISSVVGAVFQVISVLMKK